MGEKYEVRMDFETYYSGETTENTVYSKVFYDLKEAVSKYKKLSKNVDDIDLWKKIRLGVKDIKEPYPKSADFKDGYAKFSKPLNNDFMYYCERILELAYGFDYETLSVYIRDPETGDFVVRE